MVLVDTSVWVGHFRQEDIGLVKRLQEGGVVCHPFIMRFPKIFLAMGESSSAGESHLHALTDPDVNLSVHPAPIDQPFNAQLIANGQTGMAAGV